ncbi:Platelet-activating factor acetylhydrolase [Tyrophagus putrescentiae]|nr:Platelet-activating factor acetylhydrolase [Tyrophagus putrescentiae]
MPRPAKLREAKIDKSANRYHIPLPTGPLRFVGVRDFLVGYTRKGGVLVRLFYPAKVDESKAGNPLLWPNWLPHENYKTGYADAAGITTACMMRFIERINAKKNVFVPVTPHARPMPLGQRVRVEKSVQGNSAGGEPAEYVTKKYPVVVFSHGLGACRTTYSTLAVELASRGFVVAVVEHRENSACLAFFARRAAYSLRDDIKKVGTEDSSGVDQVDADDEVDFGVDEIDDPNYVPPKALSPISGFMHLEMAWVRHRFVPTTNHKPEVYRFRNRQIQHRVRECSRALDLLEALNAGFELQNLLDPGFQQDQFEGLLDLDSAVIMGHSMGGATALMTAAAELRFKVAVALDPWAFPIKDEALDLIPQPVLMINTEDMTGDEANTAKLQEMMAVIEGDDEGRRQALTINGARHFQQCDIPFVMGKLALFLSGNSMGRTGISTYSVHDITAAMSIQFINKYLGKCVFITSVAATLNERSV